MSDFQFDHLQTFLDKTIVKKGFYLWIWHADKIPPHIGCSLDGVYFSLKVNGRDDGLEVEKALHLIELKKIPCVLIPLDIDFQLQDMSKIFQKFNTITSGANTCLTPIVQILNCTDPIAQLSDLLKYLRSRGELNLVFGLNLNKEYRGIKAYSPNDIEQRLRNLENAKSKKYISSLGGAK